jgi:hypothetical protein
MDTFYIYVFDNNKLFCQAKYDINQLFCVFDSKIISALAALAALAARSCDPGKKRV